MVQTFCTRTLQPQDLTVERPQFEVANDGAALLPAIERTQPVIGKGKAAKAKKAVTATPSARISSLHRYRPGAAQRRPGRRSQGSDGEHHHRAPRRNQLVRRVHRPAERQVRGVVLSKEQVSLPVTPSAGSAAAPLNFGGLLAGPFLHHSAADCGFQWMLPLWNSFCSFGRHSRGHFRRSEPPAHHICAGRFSRLSRQCTPYVHACREPLPLPVSQSMPAIPECPNDAFQCLMSCAQATARRDAERARVRSAVTRTARA